MASSTIDLDAFGALFHDHVAFAIDKQQRMSDVIGGQAHNWQLNLRSGLLTFTRTDGLPMALGPDEPETRTLDVPIQLLGSEAQEGDDGTWLWAWANAESNIPDELQQAALSLYQWGAAAGIAAFTEPLTPLDDRVNGLTIAMVAGGMLGASSYYRCSYEGGGAYVLIKTPRFETPVERPHERVALLFPRVIMQTEAPVRDHRRAFIGYLRAYDMAIEERGDRVVGTSRGSGVVSATFDDLHRLTGLQTIMAGRKRGDA